MHDDPRFIELKRRLFRFVVPATIGFLTWYLLYVILSGYARGFMGGVLFGNVNVALVFGLLMTVYVALGGMKGTAWVQIFQAVVLLGGAA